MATLFISDLHLDPSRPAITHLFLDFLERRARHAETLYILGDLFEAWIGDDDDDELGHSVAAALRSLTQTGVPIYFIHGNRDFLLGEGFAAASGVCLLPESTVIRLNGTPTLIMHGDTLCTDDIAYQTFRNQVRSAAWQAQILALPLAARRQMAKHLRNESQQATREKAADITDVNPQAVVEAMRAHQVRLLIHGHTHRPGCHDLVIDGEPAQRIVLSDWYDQGSVLLCEADSRSLETLPLR